MPTPETLREQKIARTADREIAPVWHDRFARLIYRHLPALDAGVVLDVHSRSGRSTEALLEHFAPNVRVIGLEPSAANRALAKARVAPEWKKRVYLKPGDMTSIADMPDDAYELVVANLVLNEAHNLPAALRALLRVTKPGGTLLATLPMAGTWADAENLLRGVMVDNGLTQAEQRLRRMASFRPTGAAVSRVVRELGLGADDYVLEQERFSLLFGSGREFLFSPLVEHGPLRLWKAVIATEGNPQEVFFRLKEAIDTYHGDRPFQVNALAGLLLVRVPQEGSAGAHAAAETAGEYWRRYPTLDALWRNAEQNLNVAAEDDDIDIDLDESGVSPAPPPPEEETTQTHRPIAAGDLSDEDHAMLALLDQQTVGDAASPELDALLDQVLEFEPAAAEQPIADDDLEVVEPDPYRPGETLKRIKALLPPPPARRGPPPPPPKKR